MLKENQVRLRPIAPDSLSFIYEQAGRPENEEFFRRMAPVNTWPKDTMHWWTNAFVVERLADEKQLGLLVFTNIDTQQRSLEFGLLLDKEACAPKSRREISVEALTQMLDYVFDYLQYEKVFSKTLSHRDNIFSGYEQYGFNKDGVLRHNVMFKNEWRDEVVFSLLKSEWLNRQAVEGNRK